LDETHTPFDDVPGRLIYGDDELFVWNKPAGLPSTGRSLDDPDCLQFHLMRAHGGMVWAAHQLDADTSGLNVFATHKLAVTHMKRRLLAPNARKRYLAVVHGVPDWDRTRVDQPIGRVDARSLGVTPDGKPAQTLFRVLERGAKHSLLEVELRTGRTHQIRIHLQHLGLSLVGEEWYRDSPCLEHPRQALHAWGLEFRDEELPNKLVAPFPEDLVALARRLGCAWDAAVI